CAFCATGALGFGRNLSPGEIVGQVLAATAHAGLPPKAVRNLVFMGMGEPLLNYANTLNAARILLSDEGLGFSARRVTLSTVGLPERIERLADEDVTVKLAISLHAPDEETRKAIIPTAHAHSIESILDAARVYQRRSGRRVTFEYAMLGGINDADWQADLLADRLKGLIAHVNLIPLNDWPGSAFKPSSENRLRAFAGILEARGVPVSIRRSRGRDAGAACGQLALQSVGAAAAPAAG
ncbi:MAG TPA: 23S rRNA (adenine(2503)-C(2))-methyltransferase RlmN, partial [Deinococcales bacterium]|nr:23S rRNA (adenine(2503)-C(2))-methyltransferase RlmN [Deinococcales bacterium]